jgi:hypothetical protein
MNISHDHGNIGWVLNDAFIATNNTSAESLRAVGEKIE